MATATAPVNPRDVKSAAAAHSNILLDAGTNEVELLVFRVGSQHCAVNVAKVREARPIEPVTRLPQHPAEIEGVVRVRESLVPVVDLCRYLWGQLSRDNEADQRHLHLEFNNQLLACRVQAIDRVHRVSWREILPAPAGMGVRTPLTGIVILEGKLVLLLDFESIGAHLGLTGSPHLLPTLAQDTPARGATCPLVFADDSALIRRMLSEALSTAGYTSVRAFVDGQEAWDYLDAVAQQTTAADLRQSVAGVISDIEMPQMDGFTLTRRIREHPVLRDVPVILFSSLISADNVKKGQQVGATAQIAKPRWEELASTLLEVLGELVPA